MLVHAYRTVNENKTTRRWVSLRKLMAKLLWEILEVNKSTDMNVTYILISRDVVARLSSYLAEDDFRICS